MEEKDKILVVDDDPDIRTLLFHTLKQAGYQVLSAEDGDEAIALIDESFSAVVLDFQLPKMNGLECLRQIKAKHSDINVIMLSAVEDVSVVVEAMKIGAFWYLTKRYISRELVSLVEQALDHTKLTRENRQLRGAMSLAQMPGQYIGSSALAQDLLEKVGKVADLDSTVLITGESGTGKSLIARIIHELGPRAEKPFVMVSCAALPRDLLEAELFGHERGAFTGAISGRPGRIEIAHGGTLFLDEIGDMPLELQPKLLTFLQDRQVQRIGSNKPQFYDVRVIAATHQNLLSMCHEKKFREDLYFRVNVLSLETPALRDRREDIVEIAELFLKQIRVRRGVAPFILSDRAKEMIRKYSWPGNVRELENALERATAFCSDSTLFPEDFSLSFTPKAQISSDGMSLEGRTLENIERQAVIDSLRSCKGNKAAAARMLGISEKSIYNKIERLQLSEEVAALGV